MSYRRSQDKDAVIREFREALEDGNTTLALDIFAANPLVQEILEELWFASYPERMKNHARRKADNKSRE